MVRIRQISTEMSTCSFVSNFFEDIYSALTELYTLIIFACRKIDSADVAQCYAFMAAVPTSVFEYEGKLYSSPLLFYSPEYEAVGNADLTMNSYQGLDYFMQDWITVADQEFGQYPGHNFWRQLTG